MSEQSPTPAPPPPPPPAPASAPAPAALPVPVPVPVPAVMKWFQEEEAYLKNLHDSCLDISKEYMKLYVHTHRIQTKLRLPAIILSSFSGVASFGSSGFEDTAQKWISIGVGIINVGIAILQTYESYLKIGDIVSKSLTGSQALKKLADDIMCELSLPIEDRDSNGVTFLREAFGRYQAIIDSLPPLEHKYDITVLRASQDLKNEMDHHIKQMDQDLLNGRGNGHGQGHVSTGAFRQRPSLGEVRIELNPPRQMRPMGHY